LVVVREEGHSREGVRFESHRRYVDIQYTLSGEDLIGWKPVAQCTNDQEPFDVVKDVGYYVDRPELWIPVPTGTFVVFFPEDAHAPMGGTGLIHKIVVKVAVDWR
jgi:YhcH/YjgK/YiaL family protein